MVGFVWVSSGSGGGGGFWFLSVSRGDGGENGARTTLVVESWR